MTAITTSRIASRAALLWVLFAQMTQILAADRGVRRPLPGARVALVVGIDSYEWMGALENAVNDARSMSARLYDLGFSVTKLENVTGKALDNGIREWGVAIPTGAVSLFFYAGHGIRVEGKNYLVPVDFSARDALDAKYDGFPADRVLERMERSGSRL